MALARISHRSSAARPDLAALAGVLGDRSLQRTDGTPWDFTPPCAHHHRHLRPLATNPGEKRGLAVLFDWGDTVMRVFPEYRGPMARWPRVEVVPGIRQVLRALRPHAVIGLATNAADSEPKEIRAALGRVRLSASFGRIYCYRALGVRKPSPEYFAAVLADLGLPAGRVVLVGDDWEADVEGAVAAGLWVVWYNPRAGETRRGARVDTVHEMAAVPELLQGWGLVGL